MMTIYVQIRICKRFECDAMDKDYTGSSNATRRFKYYLFKSS